MMSIFPNIDLKDINFSTENSFYCALFFKWWFKNKNNNKATEEPQRSFLNVK